MLIVCEAEKFFDDIYSEFKKQKALAERQNQINYEFSLYKSFCRLYGLNYCHFASLMLFQSYCLENNIKLL